MTFPFDVTINLNQSNISGITNKNIIVHSGTTTFLGPNGSGKTQLLRGLKNSLNAHRNGKKIRYVSSGRLGPMESYRSIYSGQREIPRYDEASFGNKTATSRRHKTETILGDFATLSERPDILIKVQERLRKLFKRNLTIDWDGGNLKVYFARVDQVKTSNYSSAREASGLLHLVAILSALYDDDVGCLLIDEPEVSLHPQLQSFLLNEITKVAGANTEDGKKLVFLSTHSTEFIDLDSAEKLASIIFCRDILEDPIQIDPDIDELKNKKLQSLLTRLGQEHKLALFCHTPLLVEGPSDAIMCSALSRKLSLNLEAAGSQILPVTGKGKFPVVVKLMRLLGKSPALLADADAITDNLDVIGTFTSLDKANKIASEMGHRDAPKFAKDIYDDFCQNLEENWVDVKEFCELHSYWINRDKNKDENIPKRRSCFCWLLNEDNDKIREINKGENWLAIKQRLLTLLDFLEKLGCFILRKGTIEDYYRYSDSLDTNQKPNAASYEVNELIGESILEVEKSYTDIIRSMKYCSSAKEINEAEAIRDSLLAIITPALAKIDKSTTESDLAYYSNSLIGEKSGLFKLTKQEEGEKLFLTVELSSNILDVEGFPLKIKKDDNPIEKVNSALKLN